MSPVAMAGSNFPNLFLFLFFFFEVAIAAEAGMTVYSHRSEASVKAWPIA